jgi:hypothetical protein
MSRDLYIKSSAPGIQPRIQAHDFQSPYSYCGLAPEGSLATDEVWSIERIEVLLDGTTVTTSATDVAWSDRLTIIYT